jgi:hypothetical protein
MFYFHTDRMYFLSLGFPSGDVLQVVTAHGQLVLSSAPLVELLAATFFASWVDHRGRFPKSISDAMLPGGQRDMPPRRCN